MITSAATDAALAQPPPRPAPVVASLWLMIVLVALLFLSAFGDMLEVIVLRGEYMNGDSLLFRLPLSPAAPKTLAVTILLTLILAWLVWLGREWSRFILLVICLAAEALVPGQAVFNTIAWIILRAGWLLAPLMLYLPVSNRWFAIR